MTQKYQNELTLEELAALPDESVDTSDSPELDAEFWKNARVMTPEDRSHIRNKARN